MFIDDAGIIHQSHSPDTEITLEDVKQDVDLYPILTEQKKAFVLIDLNNVKSVEKQARDFLASDATANHVSAAALVAQTMISKVLGNFFLGINKPPMPVKLFNSKEAGMEWLKQVIKSTETGK